MLDTLKRGVTHPIRTVRRIHIGYDPYDPEMVLEAAADLLEREGWIQGADYEPGRGYCAIGALNKVSATDFVWSRSVGILGTYLADARSIPDWNDAGGRTREEVTEALRSAAHLRRKA